MRKKGKDAERVNNLVVISDTHCGCEFGLHPKKPTQLDGGGTYSPSALQKKIWAWWEVFWQEWVPEVCHGEPFAVVLCGDCIDGAHHKSTTQISANINDQKHIAVEALQPVAEACGGRFYVIRGTEAHVGPSGVHEEEVAEMLGAVPDAEGHYARWELWAEVGTGLAHLTHHIGTTGSSHYESSAPMRELGEAYTEAGRWNNRPPDIVVRGHRHRHIEVRVPTCKGYGIVFTCAAWQAKTPFTYKIPGARQSMPQIGGHLIRQGDFDLYTRHFVQTPERAKAVKI